MDRFGWSGLPLFIFLYSGFLDVQTVGNNTFSLSPNCKIDD